MKIRQNYHWRWSSRVQNESTSAAKPVDPGFVLVVAVLRARMWPKSSQAFTSETLDGSPGRLEVQVVNDDAHDVVDVDDFYALDLAEFGEAGQNFGVG